MDTYTSVTEFREYFQDKIQTTKNNHNVNGEFSIRTEGNREYCRCEVGWRSRYIKIVDSASTIYICGGPIKSCAFSGPSDYRFKESDLLLLEYSTD